MVCATLCKFLLLMVDKHSSIAMNTPFDQAFLTSSLETSS